VRRLESPGSNLPLALSTRKNADRRFAILRCMRYSALFSVTVGSIFPFDFQAPGTSRDRNAQAIDQSTGQRPFPSLICSAGFLGKAKRRCD
jgi:hypothetical protein